MLKQKSSGNYGKSKKMAGNLFERNEMGIINSDNYFNLIWNCTCNHIIYSRHNTEPPFNIYW